MEASMKFYVVCDYRENFKNYSNKDGELYNDHPNQKNINEIISAVKSLGYDCDYFGGIPELIHAIDQKREFKNCLFLNLTDGMEQNYSRVQAPALLEIMNVPYSGSDVFPTVIMNNKHFCKQALQGNDICMPESCIVNQFIPLDLHDLDSWSYPLFVKPNCEGSSLGISSKSVCHTKEEVEHIVNELLQSFDEIIIEEYVSGIDVTNYLIGNNETYYINDVITAELFDTTSYPVYDSKAKQNKLRTLFYNEEKIDSNTVKNIKMQSKKIAKIIGAKDICRIDYRLNVNTQKFTFIEINSAPRFSSTSEIGFIANKRGITFSHMVEYYLMSFLQRI